MPTKKSKQRKADALVEGSAQSLTKGLSLIANSRVKIWKAMLVVVFMAGAVMTMVWSASSPQSVKPTNIEAADFLPNPDQVQLGLVKGSYTWSAAPWSNSIDGDLTGLDGSTFAYNRYGRGDAYAIYQIVDDSSYASSLKSINKVRLTVDSRMSGYRRYWLRQFTVQVSTDKRNYQTVLNQANKSDGGWQEYTFEPVKAKYVKLILNRPIGWVMLTEFEVYEYSDPCGGLCPCWRLEEDGQCLEYNTFAVCGAESSNIFTSLEACEATRDIKPPNNLSNNWYLTCHDAQTIMDYGTGQVRLTECQKTTGDISKNNRIDPYDSALIQTAVAYQGDVDNDGHMTCHDVDQIVKYGVGQLSLDGCQQKAGDLTKDGRLTAYDAARMRQQLKHTGDVNDDGFTTCQDAELILKHNVSLYQLNACQIDAGDVTKDNTLSAYDAAQIAKMETGSGDVDGDGYPTCQDVHIIMNHGTGKIPALEGCYFTAGDLSGDRQITAYDASLLRRKLAGNGDVDMDGLLTCHDAQLISDYGVGQAQLDECQLGLADVSDDGQVGAYDISLILAKLKHTGNVDCDGWMLTAHIQGSEWVR